MGAPRRTGFGGVQPCSERPLINVSHRTRIRTLDMWRAPAFFEGSETDDQDDPDKSSQPKRLLGYKAGNAHLQFLSPRTAQQAQRLDDGCIWLHALWLLCSKHPNSVVLANLRKHMDQDPSPTPPPPSARGAISLAVTRSNFAHPRSHTAPDSAHRHRSQKTGESPPRYGYTPRWVYPDARALAGCSLGVQGRR